MGSGRRRKHQDVGVGAVHLQARPRIVLGQIAVQPPEGFVGGGGSPPLPDRSDATPDGRDGILVDLVDADGAAAFNPNQMDGSGLSQQPRQLGEILGEARHRQGTGGERIDREAPPARPSSFVSFGHCSVPASLRSAFRRGTGQ